MQLGLVRLSQMAANERTFAREEVPAIRERDVAQFPNENKGNKKCDCPSLRGGAKIPFFHRRDSGAELQKAEGERGLSAKVQCASLIRAHRRHRSDQAPKGSQVDRQGGRVECNELLFKSTLS